MKRQRIQRALFTQRQLAEMLTFAISEALRIANESWLPQTIVHYNDPDFPYLTRWYGHRDLDDCQSKNWTPIVTMLPERWFGVMEDQK